eukprot:TRINITY_DN14870_c0_g1_i1.p1 TRINITY_DN14870_c0_g1~~TRINITY_DN14870_c0_g1_i1.p1  ORF type:complete len:499 (+),score=164.89 TRINITY_DN14870_c0_g1_i1:73-1497(+)
MVCGWLSVDGADRWCELVGNQLRVFTDTPEAVLEVKGEGGFGGSAWEIAGRRVESRGAASVRDYWAECMARCCGDAEEEVRAREAAVERREVALLWREHELAVAEESARLGAAWRGGTESSSRGVSAEASSESTARRRPHAARLSNGSTAERHSTPPSASRSRGGSANATPAIQRQVTALADQIDALKKLTEEAASATPDRSASRESPPAAAGSSPSLRYYEGVIQQAAVTIESGIELLDSPSPVRARRAPPTPPPAADSPQPVPPPAAAKPAAPAAKAQQRMVLEVPGKVVVLDPCEDGGLTLEVNGAPLGLLTWLGYDAGRRWLTTGTASSRSGLAMPEGPAGMTLLRQLADLAVATNTPNNLPSSMLKIGDQVKTLKTFRFSSGKHLPAGTLGRVVRLTASGSVRVRTMTNEVFNTPPHTLVAVGETAAPAPKDAKIAQYVAANLEAEPAQAQLHELDNELDALLAFANGM